MIGTLPALREKLAKLALADISSHAIVEKDSFQRVSLSDFDLKDSKHSDLSFEQSIFNRVELTAACWDELELAEVLIESCSLANARCCDGRWQDVLCSKSRFTGLNLAGSHLHQVRLEGCKLDLSVWHDAKCTSCTFYNCNLREADFQGATLKDCVFRKCDLRGARFPAVKLERIDWRGSHLAGMLIDPEALQNTTIDPGQLLEFAALLGLDVRTLESDDLD